MVGTTPLKSSSASSLLSTSTTEAKTSDVKQSSDHIYEEIVSSERKDSSQSKRPLPPIPGHKGKKLL